MAPITLHEKFGWTQEIGIKQGYTVNQGLYALGEQS